MKKNIWIDYSSIGKLMIVSWILVTVFPPCLLIAGTEAAAGSDSLPRAGQAIENPVRVGEGPPPLADSSFYRASRVFLNYLRTRSAALKGGWIFGPNLDDAYFYRLRYFDTSEIDLVDSTSRQRRVALEEGIPALEEISSEERRLLMLMTYLGRRQAVPDSSHAIVIKHFPGGPRILEHTEHISRPLVLRGGAEAWQSSLDLFRKIICGSIPPGGIMTSHACYPDLEEDLAVRYPDLGQSMQGNREVPATFSALILRGVIRREFAYPGPVISDWMDMGAINRYILDHRTGFPASMQSLSSHAQVVVLAIEAGNTLITGMTNRLRREKRSRTIDDLIEECTRYALMNRGWEERLREAATVLIHWAHARGADSGTVSLDTDSLTIPRCLRIVLGEPSTENPEWLNRWSLTNFQDLWNRQGLLHIFWRLLVVSDHIGVSLLPLPYSQDDERVVRKDRELQWLRSVIQQEPWKSAYRAVDWKTVESVDRIRDIREMLERELQGNEP